MAQEDREAEVAESGNDLYRRHPNPVKPHSAYFYYTTGVTDERWYYFDNGTLITSLERVVKRLVRNAREDLDNPPKIDRAAKWRRRAYIIFAVDDPEAAFPPDNGATVEPLGAHTNETFFDAKEFTLDIDGRQVAIFHCTNHMTRDRRGNPLDEGERQRFAFTLNHVARGKKVDDSSTNMGPPVPPP